MKHEWEFQSIILTALDFYSSFLYPLLPCNNILSDEKNNIINPIKLVKIVDILGKETEDKNCSVLFYIYEDGTVRKTLNYNNF